MEIDGEEEEEKKRRYTRVKSKNEDAKFRYLMIVTSRMDGACQVGRYAISSMSVSPCD